MKIDISVLFSDLLFIILSSTKVYSHSFRFNLIFTELARFHILRVCCSLSLADEQKEMPDK